MKKMLFKNTGFLKTRTFLPLFLFTLAFLLKPCFAAALEERSVPELKKEIKRLASPLSINGNLLENSGVPGITSAPPAAVAKMFKYGAAALDLEKTGTAGTGGFDAFPGISRFFRTAVEFGTGFPSTLCELVGNLYARGNFRKLFTPTAAPSFREILDAGNNVVGAEVGYELTPILRIQGVGVYDTGENSAFLGPAFNYNLFDDLGLTTGSQILLNEDGNGLPNLHFAEIRVFF